MTDYYKRRDNKEHLTRSVFRLFTDACGGNPIEFADILYNKHTVECFDYSDDSKYWAVIEYFRSVVVPHKIEVYKAGVGLLEAEVFAKAIVSNKDEYLKNLWLHDLSKFSANEAMGYAFYNRKTESGKELFELAWHHHKMNNPHHPEYWLNPKKDGTLEPIRMPNIYIVEMIADWIGAGKVYGSSLKDWLPGNVGKFLFHEQTASDVSLLLYFLGFNTIEENGKLTYREADFALEFCDNCYQMTNQLGDICQKCD